jgi:gliding motility-associated-like protein
MRGYISVACFFLLVMLGSISSVHAQRTLTNKGKDFWLGFMNNSIELGNDTLEFGGLSLSLVLSYSKPKESNKLSTAVRIRVPGTGYEHRIILRDGEVRTYNFGDPNTVRNIDPQILRKIFIRTSCVKMAAAVNVNSDDSINCYLNNSRPFTRDMSVVFHSGVMGSRYVVGTYTRQRDLQNFARPLVMIVAKYNNTKLVITPTARITAFPNTPTNRDWEPGVPKKITLNQGELIQLQSSNNLTGTRIELEDFQSGDQCTPFAVFAGNLCTDVEVPACDHLVEQLLPFPDPNNAIERSREFILYGNPRPSNASNEDDLWRFVQLTNERTTITVYKENGTKDVITLPDEQNRNFFDRRYQTASRSRAYFVQADKPISVFQLNIGGGAGGTGKTDPFMIIIPPVEMMGRSEVITDIPNLGTNKHGAFNGWEHFINIYANRDDINNIKLKKRFIDRQTNTTTEVDMGMLSNIGTTYKQSLLLEVLGPFPVLDHPDVIIPGKGNPDYVIYTIRMNDARNADPYDDACSGIYILEGATKGMMTTTMGQAAYDSYGYVSGMTFVATPNLEANATTTDVLPCARDSKGMAFLYGSGGRPFEIKDPPAVPPASPYYYKVIIKDDKDKELDYDKLYTFNPQFPGDTSKKISIGSITGTFTDQGNTTRSYKDTVMHFIGLTMGKYKATLTQFEGCSQDWNFTISAKPPIPIPFRDTVCRDEERYVLVKDLVLSETGWCVFDKNGNRLSDNDLITSEDGSNGKTWYLNLKKHPYLQDTDNDSVIVYNFYKNNEDKGELTNCDISPANPACKTRLTLYFRDKPKINDQITVRQVKYWVENYDAHLDTSKFTFFAPKSFERDSIGNGYIPINESVESYVDSIYKYYTLIWDFGDDSRSDDVSDKYNVEWEYPKAIKSYKVSFTLADKVFPSCSTRTEITVNIKDQPNYIIKVPNVFTPNNDGSNDNVVLENFGIRTFEMIIYDRWGMEVWRGTDINKGWDGKVKGKDDAAEGQYFWVITANTVTNVDIKRTGSITLLR